MFAKADRPLVGGFEANAAIGAAADMSAFDREVAAAWNRAAMAPHPVPMSSTGAGARLSALLRQKTWRPQFRHPPSPAASKRGTEMRPSLRAACVTAGLRQRGLGAFHAGCQM